MQPLASGAVTISDNYFTGASAGALSTASWGRGIWFDGGGDDLTVAGNTFEYVRTGINLDMSGDSAATVNGNTFTTNGTAVSVNIDTDGVQLANNHFENVSDDFNFRNVPTAVIFDAAVAIATLTPADPISDPVVVFGGNGFDQLFGTEGADVLDGNNFDPAMPTTIFFRAAAATTCCWAAVATTLSRAARATTRSMVAPISIRHAIPACAHNSGSISWETVIFKLLICGQGRQTASTGCAMWRISSFSTEFSLRAMWSTRRR